MAAQVKAMEEEVKTEEAGEMALIPGHLSEGEDQKRNVIIAGSDNNVRHTKKKRENWRPKRPKFRCNKANPSQKACINNCEVMFRHCRSFVMFEITSFTSLLLKSLPLRMSNLELKNSVAAFAKARRPQMAAEAKAWRHDYLSWKAFKHFLEHNLHDQCLKGILRSYVPQGQQEVKFEGSLGVGKAPTAFLGNNDNNDFIKIAGVTVNFFVKGNKVYFDLLGAFTLMGQLQVALKNDWREIDDMLEKQGFNLRTAFRINTSPVSSYKTWKSQRSAVTYEALKALVNSDLMPKGPRKARLKAILEHLDTDMMGITRAREDLIFKIQAVVDENVLPLDPLLDSKLAAAELSVNENVLMGTEICYRGCGRYYHFTIKCCHGSHKMKIADNLMSYIVHDNQIFLEKCAAFSLMGKMCVVRFSDYRTVDRHISSAGLEISQNFLYEHSLEKVNANLTSGRRTHISLIAFKALLESGFSCSYEPLSSSLKGILSKEPWYKSKCEKYEGKDRIEVLEEETENINMEEDESSSSGIESGANSEDSNSGKVSPFSNNAEVEELETAMKACLVGQFELRLSVDNNKLYCLASDLCPILNLEKDLLLKYLKRRCKSVDVDTPFRPKMLLTSKTDFFSVKCMSLLLSKNYFDVARNLDKKQVINELNALVEAHEGQEEVEEELEMIEEDSEPISVKSEIMDQSQPLVSVCGSNVPFHVVGRNVYLGRTSLMSDLFNIRANQGRNAKRMDLLISESGIKDAFLFYGRHRKYISISALRVLMHKGFLYPKEPFKRADIEACLEKLLKDRDSLMAKKVVHLSSFGNIAYKLARGTVFLNTIHFLKASGCSLKYLTENPSKSYFVILRLLRKRGLNIKECFLKQGQCKYGHISIKGAFTLFKTESGPFRNKKRMKRLLKELQLALKNLPFYNKNIEDQNNEDNHHHEEVDVVADVIAIGDCKVKYQIKEGILYFHRLAIFEAIGLEKALILANKGLPAINKLLVSHKLEINQECYLKSAEEQFGFISFPALWTILDAEDPLVTMLDKRSAFAKSLLNLVHQAVSKAGKAHILEEIPLRIQDGKVALHKGKTVAFSGLYDKAHLLQGIGDFVDLGNVLKFVRLDSDIKRSSEYSKLIWTDMISAVMHETPKLRVHVKLIEFRQKLIKSLHVDLVAFLSRPDTILSDAMPVQLNQIKPSPDIIEEHLDSAENVKEETVYQIELEDDNTSDVEVVNEEEFKKLETSVKSTRSGLIGDWHVKRCDDLEIRLIVNPGYGASKKISFLNPDVSAILKYELALKPNAPVQLSINDLRVPAALVTPIFKQESEKGLFSLLYNLLTLRPCFGNFQPELVETFEKRGHHLRPDSSLVIDTNFIGSSQNGRTYAGTVRSKKCSVLATSKVSDMCNACSNVQVVINRSVLVASPSKKGRTLSQESSSSSCSNASNSNQQHQSVWKVEESSLEGCTFFCPQLQSFNTSLPFQFMSTSQASSVVEHRVLLDQNLAVQVTLNNKKIIGKNFPEFEKNKQVGPLLDSVASLRMCVGYPDPVLVAEAKYLMANKAALSNDIRKFFNFISVDEDFSGKIMNTNNALKGTMRANSCCYVASDHADICDQCRLLQEPLNFLVGN